MVVQDQQIKNPDQAAVDNAEWRLSNRGSTRKRSRDEVLSSMAKARKIDGGESAFSDHAKAGAQVGNVADLQSDVEDKEQKDEEAGSEEEYED